MKYLIEIEDIQTLTPTARPLKLAVRLSLGFAVCLLVLGAAWGFGARTESVAQASGVIRPDGELKRVQTTQGGKIARILSSEGTQVQAGELILQFETAEVALQLDGLREEKQHLLDTLKILEAKQADLSMAGTHRLEEARTSVQLATVELEEARRTTREDASQAQDTIEQTQQELDFARKKMTATQKLFQDGLVSQATLDEVDLQLKTCLLKHQAALRKPKSASVQVEKAQKKLVQADELAAIVQADHLKSQKDLGVEMASSQKSLEQLNQKITLLESTLILAEVRAPITGTVGFPDGLYAGKVMKPGDNLFFVVPPEKNLLVELHIPNQEVGKVQPGQKVKFQLDAFPYLQYGTVTGEIIKIAVDSEPKEGKTDFRAWASLHQMELQGIDQSVGKIKIGMTAKAEIFTGRKSFFFASL